MPQGVRRPPPDRGSILSSIGLPPREEVPIPASPTYDPGRPQGTRGSRADSARSYPRDRRQDPDGPRYQSKTEPRRQEQRTRDSGYDSQPQRSRHESLSSRAGDRKLPTRSRTTTSSRRPAIPSAYVDDDSQARQRARTLRDQDRRDQRDGNLRNQPAGRSSVRGEKPQRERERERPRDDDRGAYREKPSQRSVESEEELDRNGEARQIANVSRAKSKRREAVPDLEPYEDIQESAPNSRTRSRSAPQDSVRRTQPSTYGKEARADDLLDQESKGTSKRRSVLSRVLSADDRPAQGPPPSRRLTRYNTVKRAEPVEGRDARVFDEREEARLAKETLSANSNSGRSRAFDESDPRWYKGEPPRARENQRDSLQRRPSEAQRARDRERQKTLDVLDRTRRSGQGSAAVATNGKAKGALPAAAATVVTAAAGGVAVARAKAEPVRAAETDSDTESSSLVSSADSDLLEDAPEAPDVYDEDAISSIVTGRAPPAGTRPAAAVPSTVQEVSSEDEESSSEEETSSDESEQAPQPAVVTTKVASAAVPLNVGKSNGTVERSVPAPAIAGTVVVPALAPAAAAPAVESEEEESDSDDDSSVSSSSEATSSEDEEETDEEAAPVIAPVVAPASQSKARKAPATVAALAAGALRRRKSDELREKAEQKAREAARREREAKREKQRLLAEKAELERAAEAERIRAEKASRKDEKRKAKEAAAALAAVAAVKEKEAKKERREQQRQAREQEKAKAREAKRTEAERREQDKSEARDRVVREREEAEARKLLAMREAEKEKEDKLEARRQSRRRPHGGKGPALRSTGVRPLTAQQRHYLLKALVTLQMQSEFGELEKFGALTEYGYPFSSTRSKLTRIKTIDKSEEGEFAKSARDPYASDDKMREAENLQEPLILRHLFHVHLHSLPGLDKAPEKYWQKRIQPFFDEMAARNFSTSLERGEITKRQLYSYALTRYLGTFFARGFGVRGEGELRGPGMGEPGSEKWGVGKQWGKGTVKRGLDKPIRIEPDLMAKIDNLFDGEAGRLWKEAGKDWSKVRRDWCGFKESIIESETGLEEVISYLDISSIKNLPPHYKNSVEYARNHAAYIFHALFVTAPNADELYKVVKGIHALTPYWGAKQLLKYANAETMISGILSLLLARPGGAKSLIQRVFSYVIGKDATYIQKEFVVPIRKEIDDMELTRKVEEYVKRGDRLESRQMHETALKRGEDILTTILLSPTEPRLGQQARDHVLELQRCFALSPYQGDLGYAYPETTPLGADKPPMPSWGAQGAEHGRARKFALLKLLLRESLKRRDREQAVELASGSLIPAILKDSLETVFYPAIRTIAAHANLSDRLGDLQKFIDDLLETKKRKDDGIEAWIALAARHEQSLYFIFHECASISKPLWDYAQLGLDYMALSTTDPANPADRSVPNLEANFEELLQDARLSEGDVKKVLGEIDHLIRYTKWYKVRYELEARRNILLARPESASAGGLCVEALQDDETLKREVDDVDGMMRDLLEEEGETLDDGVCDDGVRGTEKYDFPWAFFSPVDPLNQHLPGEPETGSIRATKVPVQVAPPSLKHTRKVLPLFCELLASKMPEWQSEDVLGNLGLGGSVDREGGMGSGLGSRLAIPSLKRGKSTSTSLDGRTQKGPSETKSLMSTTSSFARLRMPSIAMLRRK